MSMNRFLKKFENKSDLELKSIVQEKNKYDPKAVSAAIKILKEKDFKNNLEKTSNHTHNKLHFSQKNKVEKNNIAHQPFMRIFVPEKRFPISPENVIFIILLSITCICFYTYNLNKIENSFFESLAILFTIITFIYFVILIVSNLFRYERLKGRLKGQLKFRNDRIEFDNKHFKINQINKIIIDNWHIRGDIVNISFEFSPKKSNGIKNYVELHLEGGSIEKCYFLQTEKDKIQKFASAFKRYYNLGLMSFQNYENVSKTYYE